MGMEYKGAQAHLASGSWSTVVTAATGKSNVIKLAQATNVTSSAATLNLAVSASGGPFYIAKNVSINTQASYVAVDDPIVLEAGNKLQAECVNINNGLDLVVSYLQISSSIA